MERVRVNIFLKKFGPTLDKPVSSTLDINEYLLAISFNFLPGFHIQYRLH